MPNVILYRRIIDDGKFHKNKEKDCGICEEKQLCQRFVKEQEKKEKGLSFFTKLKNSIFKIEKSALSAALRQRLS